MKWTMLVLACISLFVFFHLGQPLSHFKSGTVNSDACLIALGVASPSIVGMVMAGLVGITSILAAARIQISENKKNG